jgi:hypothetical protein
MTTAGVGERVRGCNAGLWAAGVLLTGIGVLGLLYGDRLSAPAPAPPKYRVTWGPPGGQRVWLSRGAVLPRSDGVKEFTDDATGRQIYLAGDAPLVVEEVGGE